MTPVKIWLGYPYPLGATWLGNGVNFALFSETATSVDLCLFDDLEAPLENIRATSLYSLIGALAADSIIIFLTMLFAGVKVGAYASQKIQHIQAQQASQIEKALAEVE